MTTVDWRVRVQYFFFQVRSLAHAPPACLPPDRGTDRIAAARCETPRTAADRDRP